MELSSEIQEQPSLNKKEVLYTTIENRIETLVNLWKKSCELPVPSPEDSPEVIDRERKLLREPFESAVAQNPQWADKYSRFKALDKQLSEKRAKQEENEESEEGNEELDSLAERWDSAFKDTDVQFLSSLDNGTRRAIEQRNAVRTVLKNIGPDGKIPPTYIPKEYKKLLKSPLQIWPQRFSIAVLVAERAFESSYKEYGPNNRTSGIYPRGSIWSFIREAPLLVLNIREVCRIGDDEFEEFERKFYSQTSRHEDFHAFAEGFLPENIKSNPVYRQMKMSLERLNTIKSEGGPSFVLNKERTLLRSKIDSLVDTDRDELLAEFASIEDRNERPSSTFVSLIAQKRSFLSKFRGADPETDEKIDKALKILDVQVLREKIKALYKQVEEKAPERKESLDAAFVLFPISQIRHVEGLVKRWVNAGNNQTPSVQT